MTGEFKIPQDCLGRFAIVKLWPDIKAAEDECIARIKVSAKSLGLKCREILSDGHYLDNPKEVLKKEDVDFVIHLHYDTAKLYDAYSFVALWNPVSFYHEWGYTRCTRNLISHDDFLSCSSDAADNHLRRLIKNSDLHLDSFLNLYHSISDIVYPPSLGDQKLFYIGINWEVLGRGESRHQALLKALDKKDCLRIYGPTKFQGVRVWAGYKSYVKEIPFDGVSTMKEINKAGIVLVLSSQAHKESELMTNRLFEGIASGALIICDENKFAKKHFGENILYIDSRDPIEKIVEDIEKHLLWIKANPKKALEMITGTQKIFKDKFSLSKNLKDLYQNLAARKQKIAELNFPEGCSKPTISLNLFMPEFSNQLLETHIKNANIQDYEDYKPRLVIDSNFTTYEREKLNKALQKSRVKIELYETIFFEYKRQKVKHERKLGDIIYELINKTSDCDAIVFVGSNEQIFSNHLSVLAGCLARNPQTHCAATATILKHTDKIVHGNYEPIEFLNHNPAFPMGYARFIFRIASLPPDLNIALPYLGNKPLALLIGDQKIIQAPQSTVVIQTEINFPAQFYNQAQENELILSYSPQALFQRPTGWAVVGPAPEFDINYMAACIHDSIRRHKNWILRKIYWFWLQLRALKNEGWKSRLRAASRKFGLSAG